MKPDLIISKKNEVYFTIDTSESIAYSLRDRFTFMVPNAHFMPAVKNKIWDGKIRLFNLRDNSIYSGLQSEIEKFCEERELHYTYDFEDIKHEYTDDEIKTFFEEINTGKELREHQVRGVRVGLSEKKCLLLSPTSSGKSLIMYMLVRKLEKTHNKMLIVVPTIQLVEQLYKDFESYSELNGWNTDDNVHRIYEGRQKNSDKLITISTWQSIYKQSPGWFEQFDVLMGDEVHGFKAKSLEYIAASCINSDYRIGLTGTLDDSLTHKMCLEGLFGPVHIIETMSNLMKKNYVSNLKIQVLMLKHPESVCKIARKWKYQEEIDYIASNNARNKFIRNLALSLDGNVLILFHRIEKHGKLIYKMIEASLPKDKQLHFIYGGTAVEQREKIRDIVAKSKNNIVLASFGTTSTGVNIPDLHYEIFASSYKAKIKNLQSIGRVIRIGTDGSNKVTLFDIADDLQYGKSKENYGLKHLRVRLMLYAAEKFHYKINKIDLKE